MLPDRILYANWNFNVAMSHSWQNTDHILNKVVTEQLPQSFFETEFLNYITQYLPLCHLMIKVINAELLLLKVLEIQFLNQNNPFFKLLYSTFVLDHTPPEKQVSVLAKIVKCCLRITGNKEFSLLRPSLPHAVTLTVLSQIQKMNKYESLYCYADWIIM